MKVCRNCGTKNADDSLYCEQCGEMLEKEEQISTKDNLTEVAEKTFANAKNVAGQLSDVANQLGKVVNDKVKAQKEKASQEAKQKIVKAQKKPRNKEFVESARAKYMSSTELWSWLLKDSKRQHFFTEEENTITPEEYMQKLQQKLEENQVPAQMQVRDIRWDRSNVKQRICYIQPSSDLVDPLSCLVQFNHVGKFTFVEEKTFITPPNLPEVPQRKVSIPENLRNKGKGILWGILICLIGLLVLGATEGSMWGWIAILFGGAMVWTTSLDNQKLEEMLAHNRNCEEQERAWNRAWEDWQNTIFLHSFQENINGQISRIYDSVFECIKQLNQELFAEQASFEQQESQSMNELEQMIARRKDDYR